MPTLVALAVKLGIAPRFAKAAVIGVLIALALAILGTAKCAYDKSVIDQHEAKVEQRARPATDKAATERANDAIAIAKSEQEKHDVIHSVPDAALAGPSHALACKRLHDLGRHPPACR